jgi:hypothetical protein
MEFISILRLLARHRLLVCISAAAAMLVGLLLAFEVSFWPPGIKSREAAATTTASALVLIGSPRNPAVDLDSQVAETLPLRAQLLAELLTTKAQHVRIAQTAGLRPQELAVLGPSSGPPPLPMTLAVRAADAARVPLEPFVLQLLANGQIPIITIKVTGFDGAAEERLTSAAAKSLQDIVANRRSIGRRLTAEQLGSVSVVTKPPKSRTLLGIAAAALVFLLLCGAIVVLPAVGRLSAGKAHVGSFPRAERP